MNFYSQKNPEWSGYKYYGNYTLGSYGCFITSLSMLDGRTPPEVAQILKSSGAFVAGGYLDSDIASKVLGLDYDGKTSKAPKYVCIAETDHYSKSGYPQHFFVWLGNGEIYDPLLDHAPTVNFYNIVSYRLFKPKGEEVDYAQLHEWNIELVRKGRDKLLGHIDNDGAEADGKLLDEKFKSGDKYEAGNVIQRYVESGEFNDRWILKSEAQKIMDKELEQAQTISNNRITSKEEQIKNLQKNVVELEGLLHTQAKMQQTQKQFSFIKFIKDIINIFRKEK